jgi:Domain of unknown function (DUF4123)
MEQRTEIILDLLFDEQDGMQLFTILDGASVSGLLEHLTESELEYECLYRGDLAPDMAQVAPYLVRLAENSPFTLWVLDKGWGNHWGIFARSPADLPTLRRHFRRFLKVYDANAKPLYFRYYDPRVLRVFLPTCNAGELDTMFGIVDRYLMEDEQGGAVLSFRNNSGVLAKHIDELKDAIQER